MTTAVRKSKTRLTGTRLRLLYGLYGVLRVVGLGSRPEKALAMPLARRKAMRPPGWATLPRPADVAVQAVTINGRGGPIALRLYQPAQHNAAAPRLLFLHGGGWIHGGLDTLDYLCAAVSRQAQCLVASVEYRLAPETPFPGALDDCDDALQWLASDPALGPLPAAGVAVMGESAGGNLAAALCLLRARRGDSPIRHQTLIYPALDATLASESMYRIDQPGLEPHHLQQLLDVYRGNAALTDPLLSPMFAENPAALPPALIITADVDPLRDDGARFARKLGDAGVHVEYVNYEGMPHGFFFMPRICSAAEEGIALISRTLAALAAR